MSANGFVLQCDGYELRSAWPAAFYVLHRSIGPDGPDEPLLQHCETFADAKWRSARGGIILDSEFTEVPS